MDGARIVFVGFKTVRTNGLVPELFAVNRMTNRKHGASQVVAQRRHRAEIFAEARTEIQEFGQVHDVSRISAWGCCVRIQVYCSPEIAWHRGGVLTQSASGTRGN